MPDDKKKRILERLDQLIGIAEQEKSVQPEKTDTKKPKESDGWDWFFKPILPKGDATIEALKEPGRLFNKGASQLLDNPLAGALNIAQGVAGVPFLMATVPLAFGEDFLKTSDKLVGTTDEKGDAKGVGNFISEGLNGVFQTPAMLYDLGKQSIDNYLRMNGIAPEYVDSKIKKGMIATRLMPRGATEEQFKETQSALDEAGKLGATILGFGGAGKLKNKLAPKVNEVKVLPKEEVPQEVKQPTTFIANEKGEIGTPKQIKTLEELKIDKEKVKTSLSENKTKLQEQQGDPESVKTLLQERSTLQKISKEIDTKITFKPKEIPKVETLTVNPEQVNQETGFTDFKFEEPKPIIDTKPEFKAEPIKPIEVKLETSPPSLSEKLKSEGVLPKSEVKPIENEPRKENVVQSKPEVVEKPITSEPEIAKVPRSELPEKLSEKIKGEAEGKLIQIQQAVKESQGSFREQGNVGQGFETIRTEKAFTISDFPEWFSELGRNKKDVINALKKIIEDKGKDKGKLVEEVKSVILNHLKEGEEISVNIGTSGKFKKHIQGKTPPDIDVGEFLQRFEKSKFTSKSLDEAFKEYESETSFKFGANEKLTGNSIIDRLRTEALDEFKNRQSNPSGFNPLDYKAGIKLGAYHLKNGVVKFADWSAQMIKDLGEKIKPQLLRIWSEVKKFGEDLGKIALEKVSDFVESKYNPARPLKIIDQSLMDKYLSPEIKSETKLKDGVKDIAEELDVPYSESWIGKSRNYLVAQSNKVVGKMGDSGKIFAGKIEKMKDFERAFVGIPSEIAFDIKRLNKAEQKSLSDIRQAKRFNRKEPIPVNDNVKSMNERLNKYYDSLVSEYQKRHIETENKYGSKHDFTPLPNYEPRKLTFKLDELGVVRRADGKPVFNEKRDKIIKAMVKEGKAKNNAEASYILDNFIMKSRIKKAGNIEYARELDLPEQFYVSDPAELLISYSVSAGKRLGFIDNFGAKGEIASDLLNTIKKDGYNENFARDLYRYETGQLNAQEHRMIQGVNKAKGWQALTKFTPFTTLRNALQGFLGTTTRGNLKAGVVGALKSLTVEGKRSAYRSGALVDQIERIIQTEMVGGGDLAGKYIDLIGFTARDVTNRVISAAGGEVFYKDMLKRIKTDSFLKARALREFEKIGLDAKEIVKRGEFTPDEINLIKRTFAGDAQFNIRPSDLPLFWSSPTGKILTQWKSFGYKMAQLINDNILKEVRHGNLAPLTTALVAYGVAGETVSTIIDYVREVFGNALKGKIDLTGKNTFEKSLFTSWTKKQNDAIALRIISDVSSLGAMGLFVDVVRSLGYGKAGVVGAVLGPTVGEAIQTTEDILSPTGEVLTGDYKNFIPKTTQGVVKTTERNIPAAGILRTVGATKIIDKWTKEIFPSSSGSRQQRQSRNTRR